MLASSLSSIRLTLAWDRHDLAGLNGMAEACGTRHRDALGWHGRRSHLLWSTDAGPTWCMFCAKAGPSLLPSRHGRQPHALHGRQRAVWGAAARTAPTDSDDTFRQVPAYRHSGEQARPSDTTFSLSRSSATRTIL